MYGQKIYSRYRGYHVQMVLDNQDCINKAQDLLVQRDTYRTLAADPTNKHKNKLISMVRTVKPEGGQGNITHKGVYPTGTCPSQILWPTQDPQKGHPLRSIVSSRGAVICGMAKELANILRPLVGNYPHHNRDTQDFVEQVKSIRLGEGESITIYDVKALFPSVPINSAISIIRDKLEQDTSCL